MNFCFRIVNSLKIFLKLAIMFSIMYFFIDQTSFLSNSGWWDGFILTTKEMKKKNLWIFKNSSRCLKVTKKSHSTLQAKPATFYLRGQKFTNNPKMVNFDEFLKTWSLRSNTVIRHVTLISMGQKLMENAKIRHFGWFSNNVNNM